jgi:hypothetical protein
MGAPEPTGGSARTFWHHDELVGLAPFARTRIGHHLRNAGIDDRRRRWLLAIALVVGIATGDTSSTSTVVSELAMADLATAV